MEAAKPEWIPGYQLQTMIDQGEAELTRKLAVRPPWLAGNPVDYPGKIPDPLVCLPKFTNLTVLCLISIDVDARIMEILAGLGKLRSLNVSECRFLNNSIEHLATLGNLTSLKLRHTSIGDEGAKEIAKLNHLTSLDLVDNEISDKGAKAIGDAHEDLASLTRLDLSTSRIGDVGATAIANLQNLIWLDLSSSLHSSRIGNDGAKAIAANLSKLTSLNLSGHNIGNDGARTIAENLTKLTSLNLIGSNVGDEGAEAIAENLIRLTSLSLSGKNIGHEGAKAIASLANLTSLDLSANNVGIYGAKAIAVHPNLTSLKLRGIGYEEALAFLDALVDAPNAGQLRTLDLTGIQKLRYPLTPDILRNRDAKEILDAYRVYRAANQNKTAPAPNIHARVHSRSAETGAKKPHWLVEHAAKVAVGTIVATVVGGILLWIGASHETLWDKARCTLSSDPVADGCPPSGK